MKKILLCLIFSIMLVSVAYAETEGPEIEDFKLENGEYVFNTNWVYSDIYIDGSEVNSEQSYGGGAARTVYRIFCTEGDLLEAKSTNTVSGEVTSTSYDISDYKCDEEQDSECIDSDGLNYYKKGKVVIDPYFDGSRFVMEDSCGSQRYEGYVIEPTCNLNDNGDTYVPEHFKCPNGCINGACIDAPSDDGRISYEFIHLHPNTDNLVLYGSSINIYSDVQIRQEGDDTLNNVKVKMAIPELDLEDIQVINILKPNWGTPTPNQPSISIPYDIQSGEYKVKFYANDKLLKTFTRGFYRDDEISCSDSDDIDFYNVGRVALKHDSGLSVRSESDACCKNCNTAPSDDGPFLSEYYCDEDDKIQRRIYECPLGCKNGKCIGNVEPIEEDEPVEVPEPDVIEKTVFVCGACELDNICYPVGFRKDKEYCSGSSFSQQKEDEDDCNNPYECTSNICEKNQCGKYCEGCKDSNKNCIPFGTRVDNTYCSLDKKLETQKSNEESCNNNYECSSNVCVNDECISPNLLQKILNWFKNLFG